MEILDAIHRIDAEVAGRPLYLFLFLGEFILPCLDSLGLAAHDLDLLVITHPDADDQGGAHALADASPGLTVACAALDREMVSNTDTIMARRDDAYRADHGIGYDGDTTAWLREMCDEAQPAATIYAGGETIDLGRGRELRVLHVPGHSPDTSRCTSAATPARSRSMRAPCAGTSARRGARPSSAPRRRSTSRCGISADGRPGSRCTACSAARAANRAGYRYIRSERGQAVMNWGLPEAEAEGTYEDLDAFLHREELALDLLAQGITGMKIWPFDPYAEASLGHDIRTADLDRALEPFRKIRAAAGSEIDVMVELDALWDVPAACRIAAALDEFAPAWIEAPVRVSSPGALAEVQRATRSPLAVGETLSGLAAYRDLIAGGGGQIVVFDVGWVGGVTEARKVAALAEAFEPPVAPHDCTGPVVYTAATHLSMHLPNAMIQESVRAFTSGWYADVVTDLPAIEDRMVSAPEGPGLGTALRPEVFERADAHVRSTVEGGTR